MRFRSRTNSRPWCNATLYNEYGAANLDDELIWAFPGTPREALVPIGGNTLMNVTRAYAGGTERHHISGGILGTQRWDRVTNLICTSHWPHVFCDNWARDGFALCAASKIKKGEWDRDEMAKLMGVASTIGWLNPEREFEFPWVKDVIEPYLERI